MTAVESNNSTKIKAIAKITTSRATQIKMTIGITTKQKTKLIITTVTMITIIKTTTQIQ